MMSFATDSCRWHVYGMCEQSRHGVLCATVCLLRSTCRYRAADQGAMNEANSWRRFAQRALNGAQWRLSAPSLLAHRATSRPQLQPDLDHINGLNNYRRHHTRGTTIEVWLGRTPYGVVAQAHGCAEDAAGQQTTRKGASKLEYTIIRTLTNALDGGCPPLW
jgi:hypothetical protein